MPYRTLHDESFGQDQAANPREAAAQATLDRNNRLLVIMAATATLLAAGAAVALSFI